MTWEWPWSKTPEAVKVVQYSENVGPYQPQSFTHNTEFAPIEYIQSSVSSVSANVSRLFSSSPSVVSQAEDPCQWYSRLNPFSQCNTITKGVTTKVQEVGSFLQSTMFKILIIVTLTAVIALVGMSYIQAKGVQLAK